MFCLYWHRQFRCWLRGSFSCVAARLSVAIETHLSMCWVNLLLFHLYVFAFLRFHSPPNGILCTRKKIPYSGKLFEGENFCEFHGFVAVHESFLREIWGVASFGTAKMSNPRKFYPQKSYFHQFAKVFSLKSFPLYGNS